MTVELGEQVLYTDSRLEVCAALVLRVNDAGKAFIAVFPPTVPHFYIWAEEATEPGVRQTTWSRTPAARRLEALSERVTRIERELEHPWMIAGNPNWPFEDKQLAHEIVSQKKPVVLHPSVSFKSADRLPEDVVQQLDPGIRDLVVYLRALGFDTCDSGDGYSKPADERVFHVPHVAARCDLKRIVESSDFLLMALTQFVEQLKGDEHWRLTVGKWHVETSYSPNDGSCIMLAMIQSE